MDNIWLSFNPPRVNSSSAFDELVLGSLLVFRLQAYINEITVALDGKAKICIKIQFLIFVDVIYVRYRYK